MSIVHRMEFELFILAIVILIGSSSAEELQCGYTGLSLDARIIGGSDAKQGEFPHQVSFQSSKDGSTHVCGGSIINETWILTAAHCVSVMQSRHGIIKAGKHLLDRVEEYEQVIKISKMFSHNKFNSFPQVGPYDIALLKLETPLLFNDYVKPINLPIADDIPIGVGTVSGWGKVSSDSPFLPNVLQTADFPVIDFDTCKRALITLTGRNYLHPTNVCTGPLTGGYSMCNGDSGGPLILKSHDKPTIIGITSWGITPCGQRGAPSIFTRVSAHIDWINFIMSKN